MELHNMQTYSKTIGFGKIAYTGLRKINQVNVTVKIEDSDKGPKLSICGEIWNGPHTDVVSCGQNIDTLTTVLPGNKKLQRIEQVWSQYHLNDMHAGTPKQEAAIADYVKVNGHHSDYSVICAYLKDQGLYEDNGYKYGSAWLYQAIPETVLNEVRSW